MMRLAVLLVALGASHVAGMASENPKAVFEGLVEDFNAAAAASQKTIRETEQDEARDRTDITSQINANQAQIDRLNKKASRAKDAMNGHNNGKDAANNAASIARAKKASAEKEKTAAAEHATAYDGKMDSEIADEQSAIDALKSAKTELAKSQQGNAIKALLNAVDQAMAEHRDVKRNLKQNKATAAGTATSVANSLDNVIKVAGTEQNNEEARSTREESAAGSAESEMDAALAEVANEEKANEELRKSLEDKLAAHHALIKEHTHTMNANRKASAVVTDNISNWFMQLGSSNISLKSFLAIANHAGKQLLQGDVSENLKTMNKIRAELRKSYEEVRENLDAEKSRYADCVARERDARVEAVDTMDKWTAINSDKTATEGQLSEEATKLTNAKDKKNTERADLTDIQRKCEKKIVDAVKEREMSRKAKDLYKGIRGQVAETAGSSTAENIDDTVDGNVDEAENTVDETEKTCDERFKELTAKIRATQNNINKINVYHGELSEKVANLEQAEANLIQGFTGLMTETHSQAKKCINFPGSSAGAVAAIDADSHNVPASYPDSETDRNAVIEMICGADSSSAPCSCEGDSCTEGEDTYMAATTKFHNAHKQALKDDVDALDAGIKKFDELVEDMTARARAQGKLNKERHNAELGN